MREGTFRGDANALFKCKCFGGGHTGVYIFQNSMNHFKWGHFTYINGISKRLTLKNEIIQRHKYVCSGIISDSVIKKSFSNKKIFKQKSE